MAFRLSPSHTTQKGESDMVKSSRLLACILFLSIVPLPSQAQERFGSDTVVSSLSRRVGAARVRHPGELGAGSPLALGLYRYNFTGYDHNFNDGSLGLDRRSSVVSWVRTSVSGSVRPGIVTPTYPTTLFSSDIYASINRTLTAYNQHVPTYAPYHVAAVICDMQLPRFMGNGNYGASGIPVLQTGEREFYSVLFNYVMGGVTLGGTMRVKGSLSVSGRIYTSYVDRIGIGNSLDLVQTGSSISADIRGRGRIEHWSGLGPMPPLSGELVVLEGTADDVFSSYRTASYDGNPYGATFVTFSSGYTENRNLRVLGGRLSVAAGGSSADIHNWGDVLNATGRLVDGRSSPTLLSSF
jgi:hypothetical protein